MCIPLHDLPAASLVFCIIDWCVRKLCLPGSTDGHERRGVPGFSQYVHPYCPLNSFMFAHKLLAGKSTEHISKVVRIVMNPDAVLMCNPRKNKVVPIAHNSHFQLQLPFLKMSFISCFNGRSNVVILGLSSLNQRAASSMCFLGNLQGMWSRLPLV